jgi:ankyrin repeat protein
MDDHDLYGSSQESHQTALHLAASSPSNGEAGRTVITTLLELYPQAAQVADGIDGSLPLHRIVENERKVHWNFDGPRDLYRAYPLAARIADANGRLPLHRAAAAIAHHSGPASENTDGRSVVCSLVEEYPEAASQTDKSGRTPLHQIAESAEVWDEGVEAILNAHPPAPRLRAGPELHNRLAIHMAAASPDARRSLIERLVELHPRGVALADGLGKLPLHLACEAAKTWDKGVRAIYDAFPDAIRQAEENERGWMPLTMAAACPNAGADLIDVLAELHPEAASQVDNDGRLALHWACVSGKTWQDGVKAIFDANPDATIAGDSNGHLPFHLAALAMCATEAAEETTEQEPQEVETPRRHSRATSMSLRSPSITEPEPDEEAPKVEILFQLLRAEPSVVHTH